jgi:hypothetical protein
MGRRLAILGSAAIAMSLVAIAPPASAATVRYASHLVADGSGAPCTFADPCSLYDAVTGASAGDTVQLTADEYYLDRQLDVTVDDLTIRGPEGIGAPGSFVAYIIFRDEASGGLPDSSSKVRLFANSTHFERLAITGTTLSAALVGAGTGTKTGHTYDRVHIANNGTGDVLIGRAASLTNSIVEQRAVTTNASAVIMTGTITGSTVYSRNGNAIVVNDSYITPGGSCALSITNSIAWGADANLLLDDRDFGCASLDVEYDYSWIPASLGGGIRTPGSSSPISRSHNLFDTPAVFDPTDPADTYLGNWVLPANSPAINAGCTGGLCSDHDYYGRPRPIGAANDIGAMEQSLTPSVSPVAVSSSTTLTSTVSPLGSATTYTLQVRSAGADWSTTASGNTADAFTAVSVSATPTLSANTDYEARIVATNARGTTTSGITAFRTSSPGLTVSGLKAKVTTKKARLASNATVTGAGRITQKATSGKGARKATRCSTGRAATTAGTYRITCRLTKKSRTALRSGPLKLRVVTTFVPPSGDPVTLTTRLRIPRRR